MLPSKSQLKNAGDRIRKRATGDLELDAEQATADAKLVNCWRSAHRSALTKTRIGLGNIVTKLPTVNSPTGLVFQRLKRFDSIVAKLVRDKTRLAEIEDIAGCRAVLPTLDAVEAVREQLSAASKLDILRVRDYNANPHPGGYRALHLWCRRDGFKVEIQLRTMRQQMWAEAVERWDSGLGIDLKHENAPGVVLDFFRALAEGGYRVDTGVAHSDAERALMDEASAAVEEWLTREVHHG